MELEIGGKKREAGSARRNVQCRAGGLKGEAGGVKRKTSIALLGQHDLA
jgi:hypothetical protein